LLQINKDIMSDLKNDQKKEWAKELYLKGSLTQKEIAEKVSCSAVTINKWVEVGKWKTLKQSMLITRESQLNRLYAQLDELTTNIMGREPGSRFANSKEADTIGKLTNAIKSMETEASIADIVEVCKRVLNWLRPINPGNSKIVASVFDDFIKHVLKRI